jgi:hypothetical protein
MSKEVMGTLKKWDCKFYDERRGICILNGLPCVLDEKRDCKNYEKEEEWV